jgi:hypothetical protein
MTIFGLLVAALATCVVVWLCSQNKIPAPFHWIAYAVLIVVWIAVLLGAVGGFGFLEHRVG